MKIKIIIIGLLLVLSFTAFAEIGDSRHAWINPVFVSVAPGETTTITVQLNSPVDETAAGVTLTYDPAVVSVREEDIVLADGLLITPGAPITIGAGQAIFGIHKNLAAINTAGQTSDLVSVTFTGEAVGRFALGLDLVATTDIDVVEDGTILVEDADPDCDLDAEINGCVCQPPNEDDGAGVCVLPPCAEDEVIGACECRGPLVLNAGGDTCVADGGGCLDADGDGLTTCDEDGNGVPNDCDDADDAVGAPSTWYPDMDQDGFGSDEAGGALACEHDVFVEDNTDCDDTDDAINPDAAEDPGNGIDENCDPADDGDDQPAIANLPALIQLIVDILNGDGDRLAKISEIARNLRDGAIHLN